MKRWNELTATEKSAAVVDLVRVRGMTYTEAAGELSTTRAAVGGRLTRVEQRDKNYVRPVRGDSGRISPPIVERKVREKDEPEFIRMWKAGINRKIIARRFDCGTHCVTDTANRLGLKRPASMPRHDKRTISSYLGSADYDRLSRLAHDQGVSIALVIRRMVLAAMTDA